MILPELHGKLSQEDFFIYAAFDHDYFNDYGPSLINSIKKNSSLNVHVHLYNPSNDQLNFLEKLDRISFTYEYVSFELFSNAASKWKLPLPTLDDELYYRRILTSMKKGNDTSIQERIQKTYYACARFIRLAQLREQHSCVLLIDSDAIVRKQIPMLPNNYDFYVHYVNSKKDPRFLAGGIYLTNNKKSQEFLNEYSKILENNIINDTIVSSNNNI